MQQDINKIKEDWQKIRTDAITEMFDNEYATGIYSTSKFFKTIDDAFEKFLKKAYQRGVDDTIKRNNQNAPIGSTCDDTPIMKTYN